MDMPEFDFATLALGLAAISLMLCGVMMAGSALFGEQLSDKAKRVYIPNTIIGLVIVGVGGFIVGLLAPA